ncbi:dormancy-associated protein-like protein 3 [Iris pallida]|uniref:Dormancy-associated protein-like protein 3 n=1 Tax=Iris pallida TaxID=29817 RepID=A0AAX6FZD6_IRIPA|nr:dormancy-associated protein-like protein 3 [Iris pallida]KAJ6821438.1 dormancy-associated protein-like protein 3 [Iris pallida]
MGLLDQLWDDTLAGPLPDSGLGKLRKHPTFSFRSRSGKESAGSAAAAVAEEEPRVTRSIMIRRPAGSPTGNATPPISPAGSTPPVSPFSGGGGKEWNRFRRKSSSDGYERPAGMAGVGPSSPPPYEV